MNRGAAVIAVPLMIEREEQPSVPLDDVAGARLPGATRLRTLGSSECSERPHTSAAGQSNMQFRARIPITVAVIGICPRRRNFGASKPNRKARGR